MIDFPPSSIHGRFQIIHHEHITYLRRAYEKYGRLYIGLTGLRMHLAGVERREARDNNPLTYSERVAMWRAVLDANEFPSADFEIGPFPIEAPEHLKEFVPTSCICATTIREEWNEAKIVRLKQLGYTVDVLYEDRSKQLSSSAIRELIRVGNDSWASLVPLGVHEFLSRTNLLDRIRSEPTT